MFTGHMPNKTKQYLLRNLNLTLGFEKDLLNICNSQMSMQQYGHQN